MKQKLINKSYGIDRYVNNSIMSKSPELLILDLYDGCIKFINLANDAFEKNEKEVIEKNINRALAIIEELIRCLDFERGGEIAKNLKELYIFILHSLKKAREEKSKDALIDGLKIVKMMRENWNVGVVKKRASDI